MTRTDERTRNRRWRARLLAGPIITALIAAGSLAPAAAQTHSFLWKATKGSSLVYLVGSVHLLTKDFYPLSPALEAAYKDSTLLVEEVDMGEMLGSYAAMQILS